MNKYILLTGASSTLAKELIIKFNKEDYIVIGISRKILNDKKNIYINLDLTKSENIQKLFNILEKKNIFPDIIIHNLGGKLKNDFHPLSSKVLEKTIYLNLGIAVDINSRCIIKALENQKTLNIIHISSDASLNGQASPAYVASKSAINAYVKSTARIYISQNIYLCAILPTKFISNDEILKDEKLNLFPLKRYLKASEVSEFIYTTAVMKNPVISGSVFTLDACKI